MSENHYLRPDEARIRELMQTAEDFDLLLGMDINLADIVERGVPEMGYELLRLFPVLEAASKLLVHVYTNPDTGLMELTGSDAWIGLDKAVFKAERGAS